MWLCIWATINNLLLKICPKEHVHFDLCQVNAWYWLLCKHWLKNVQSENISTAIMSPIYA